MNLYTSVDLTSPSHGLKELVRFSPVNKSYAAGPDFMPAPSHYSSKFGLPTLNVKAMSPKIINKYRDHRRNQDIMSSDSRTNYNTQLSPMR
jgi:hypothetical protein